MNSKLLTIALCMFCGMSFLAANGTVDAKLGEIAGTEIVVDKTKKEVAATEEAVKAEKEKAKKAAEEKTAAAQDKKSCDCK